MKHPVTPTDDLAWLEREAPRYTSYPTAHHFTPAIGAAQHHEWLSSIRERDAVSVYVHIPFCKELCWFCGCHTKATKRYEPIAAYVQVLLQEIKLLKLHTSGRGKLHQIHFGGGSPSLLNREDMLAIIEAIAGCFEYEPLGELAIELDPRTTTPENILLYAALGFNRVSIGIQDFDDVVQQAINRIQPYEMVAGVMQQLRDSGIHDINADLVYGLPHQTPERFADTLAKTLSLAPRRIALFSYAHLPEMKKHQRLIDEAALPNAREKLALYQQACDALANAGYVAIGIDHYAHPEDALAIAMQNRSMKRNFQGYVTDDTERLIGIGCSSISQFPEGYTQNSASTPDYTARIARGELAAVRGRAFAGDDLARKAIIDRLMCFLEIDLAEIITSYHLPADYFARELAMLQHAPYAGIAQCAGQHLRITTPYRMAARVVASVFDAHAHTDRRYSKVA